jgi:hypothetical protein
MCLVRNCVPAESLARKFQPKREINGDEFVLLAKRERRRFDSSSPHQFFGVHMQCANTSSQRTVKRYAFAVHRNPTLGGVSKRAASGTITVSGR